MAEEVWIALPAESMNDIMSSATGISISIAVVIFSKLEDQVVSIVS